MSGLEQSGVLQLVTCEGMTIGLTIGDVQGFLSELSNLIGDHLAFIVPLGDRGNGAHDAGKVLGKVIVSLSDDINESGQNHDSSCSGGIALIGYV